MPDIANGCARLHRAFGNLDAVDLGAPMRRAHQGCEDAQECGFARAIRSHERDDLARADIQSHASQRLPIAEELFKLEGLDHFREDSCASCINSALSMARCTRYSSSGICPAADASSRSAIACSRSRRSLATGASSTSSSSLTESESSGSSGSESCGPTPSASSPSTVFTLLDLALGYAGGLCVAKADPSQPFLWKGDLSLPPLTK